MHLNVNKHDDIVFEWISYDQFEDIKKMVGRDDIYSAIWRDGPLHYNKYSMDTGKYMVRSPNKKVVLKYLRNSHNIKNEFLNKV